MASGFGLNGGKYTPELLSRVTAAQLAHFSDWSL